ncbi:MAG: formylglycine-generating enzyme family protein [Flavobacteriales bacterium]|nr:formylglycine-generating enzyme family protein [Flavobacteriales bacterium]
MDYRNPKTNLASNYGLYSSYQREKMHVGYLIIILNIIACILIGCNDSTSKIYRETIFIPGGTLLTNSNDTTTIPIAPLEVMKYEVTNALFKEFTDATGYVTAAEKNGGSMVFIMDKNQKNGRWEYKQGASWRDPLGDNQGIHGKMNHPVVHVNYEDACRFCEWMNMRLPTAAEWQYVFQLSRADTLTRFNYWQGLFPFQNVLSDGYLYSAPVGYYHHNVNAPSDLKGNVWEWTQDYFHSNRVEILKEMKRNERWKGPPRSFDPYDPYTEKRVICGGSFLCAPNYCKGYAPDVLQSTDPLTGAVHIGFRCVKSCFYP